MTAAARSCSSETAAAWHRHAYGSRLFEERRHPCDAFGDGAVLTCLGNDFGYADVFSRQIEWHGGAGDLLIAISSSGASPNILNGVLAARSKGSRVVTFSGFREDNPLRQTGDINFYVRAQEYGFVELAHQSLLHAMLDVDRGWRPNSEVQRPRVLKRAEHG